jgi:integrase
MNDIVTLNWRKIKSYQGEHVKVAEDRPYNHNEIQTLLSHATFRNKAIILLMSSTGLRLGAVPSLRIKDLEPLWITMAFTRLMYMPNLSIQITLLSACRT